MVKEVTLSNVSIKFGSKIVLNDFSQVFKKGSIYAVVGKSGSGKSTLLNIISGFIKPDTGEVRFDELTVPVKYSKRRLDFLRYEIGYLFQNYGLVDNETVEYNLKIGSKFSDKSNGRTIEDALKYVDLDGFNSRKIYSLSGGEQQRIAIARLHLKEFKVLLADEPTGNLDSENSQIVIDSLKKNAKEGKIVIVATHDENVILASDHIIEL